MKRTLWFLWLPVVIYYAFITFASGFYGDELAGLLKYPFAGFDKIVHFCEYFVLGMILARALAWEEHYSHLKRRWYVYFAMILPLAALTDEIHQLLVPGREMTFFDWLADVTGAVSGACLLIALMRWHRNLDAKEGGERAFAASDARGSGFIVFAVYFVLMVAANIIGAKTLMFRNTDPVLAMLVASVEFLILGFFVCRLYHVLRAPFELELGDGVVLAGFGIVFLGAFQSLLYLLQSRLLSLPVAGVAYVGFLIGLGLYRVGYGYMRRRLVLRPVDFEPRSGSKSL